MRARTSGSMKRAPGTACGSPAATAHIPERGSGTTSSSRSTMSSLVTAFRLRVEVGDDAVAQHRVRQGPDVVEAHVVAAAGERPRLAAEHEILRRAHAGAEGDELLHEVGGIAVLGPAGAHDVERVPHHRLGHRHLAHQALEGDRGRRRETGLSNSGARMAGRRPHHLDLLVVGRVLDDDVEHEAIELRFGQRIGALELDRVLRREHVERLGELVGAPLNGDAVLLHRLEQRRLRLGRRAVDLVGQHDVGEDRAGREHHLAAAGGRRPPAPGRCR